jgi:hypothetical protein
MLMLMVSVLTLPAFTRAPRVRSLSNDMADLVQRAAARSPTVAAMLKTIEASDVILLIDFRLDNALPRAVTTFVGVSGAVRYVRMVINPRLPPRLRMELLGHELQHVIEIASNPAIRDQSSMRVAFSAIGWMDGPNGPYETAAALLVERQVSAELRSSPGPPVPFS